jgi:hypothetical protein
MGRMLEVRGDKLGISDDFVPLLANTNGPHQSAHWKSKKYLLNEVFWETVYNAFLISLLLWFGFLRNHS